MKTLSTSALLAAKQRGLSLVELMVALVLGLFLSAGVIQLYVGTSQSYRYEEALARIQENGRYALMAMARDIRMAGHAGCTRVEALSRTISASGVVFGPTDLISGENPDISAKADTDLIRIRRLSENGLRVDSNMTSKSGDISIARNPDDFDDGDILAIADCQRLDIFVASGGDGTSIDPQGDLSHAYEVGSEVMAFRDITYFVDGNLALRRAGTGVGVNAGEVIEGVEDMWVQFGEDTGGDDEADEYRDNVADIDDWSRIRSVRISLLLRSAEENLTDGQTISWRGADYPDPSDNHLRQVFTTTVALRSRLP